MKGLRLSEEYFFEFGLPMIENRFPEYKGSLAAGLVGEGSECFGFDDEISRDHDWGPGFCLWLNEKEIKKIGRELQDEYERLPSVFKNFQRYNSQWGEGRIGVVETGMFYKKYIGTTHPPETNMEWFKIPEQHLAACTNGKVFYDPSGDFSLWRKKLTDFYPEDVRLKKIAARCMNAAQSGQYNFSRSEKRDERLAGLNSEIKFCSEIISLVFLLNKKYVPFYKWMHRAVKKLQVLGDRTFMMVEKLLRTEETDEKIQIIEDICSAVVEELQKRGLSDSANNFLLEHGPIIQQKIDDKYLRDMNVWIG